MRGVIRCCAARLVYFCSWLVLWFLQRSERNVWAVDVLAEA
jgi:hypothetical protein